MSEAITKKEFEKLGQRVCNFHVSNKDVVSNVIYEAIRCKEYPTLPRKADVIVKKVDDICKKDFEKMSEDYYYKIFETVKDIKKWLIKNVMSIPEIQELNLSQKEFNAGISVNDPNRDTVVFTSRYSETGNMEDDFVALEALIRNVAHNLVRENIVIHYGSFHNQEEV